MQCALLISHDQDAHAVRVSEKLTARGVEALVLDTAKAPREVGFTINYQSSAPLTLSLRGARLRGDDLIGVWWRRPAGSPALRNAAGMQQYIKAETEVVIRSMYEFLPDANWISAPE